LLTVLIEQIKAVGVHTPSRRERVVRRIAITESSLPITEEFLMIVADRLASHLTLRIDEILATRQGKVESSAFRQSRKFRFPEAGP